MAKTSKFAYKQTAKGWCINVPGKFTATGKRERRYFPSRAKAKEASDKLQERSKRHGEQSASIHPLLAEQATAAEALLRPYGATLMDAASFYVEAKKRDDRSASVEDALHLFTEKKQGRSDKQLQNYRHMQARLIEDFGGRRMASITGEEIEDHISKHTGGPASFNQRLRLIGAFWRWCAKPPRQWCDERTVKQVERAETVSGHIGTLTHAQAETLLRTAEEHFPDTVQGIAVMLFTGMRRQEVERLQPEDFKPDGIEVPALSAKTRRRRFIHTPTPLIEWLKAYPLASTVLPVNWNKKYRAVRRLAGWGVWSDLVEKPAAAPSHLPKWPQNALRHTAATIALALGKPLETLVFEHGHTGGLATLRNHYIGQISKAEAEAIWALRPNPSGKK